MHYGLLEDTPPGQWLPDVLEGFSRQSIPVHEESDRPVTATLVRHDDVEGLPLLYIHGWSDYFYNTELADAAARHGHQLYALDLRKYGRSLRPRQQPGYIDHLAEYDQEINAALDLIAHEHPGEQPAMIAHSTGGLIAALWANRYPGRLRTLVLNAPWLTLQGNTWLRGFANTVADPVWRSMPERKLLLPKVDFFYRTISSNEHGEWVLHPLWRPRYSFDIHGGWLSAILEGHSKVRAGLAIDVPVLVLVSTKTHFGAKYSFKMQTADSVLDVEATAKRATHLGNTVMIHKIPDAIHDVYASARPVRDHAFATTFEWLNYFTGNQMERQSLPRNDGLGRRTSQPHPTGFSD
ncbi:MAG TPA: alpha/beta hydrolase [Enteractinococcus helveticum]|uniref:Alpha/beta hydrolase n=1 Tax=Enteractinococcus helveticum TaxID=1837282 RepID=A0A921FMC4_9MICC|nr:alpha/beta hydrolase [Enteractinococcus helveticum]HJF14086.1 alpha/beta hydrolase [Enteractinococcus helveticum]